MPSHVIRLPGQPSGRGHALFVVCALPMRPVESVCWSARVGRGPASLEDDSFDSRFLHHDGSLGGGLKSLKGTRGRHVTHRKIWEKMRSVNGEQLHTPNYPVQ